MVFLIPKINMVSTLNIIVKNLHKIIKINLFNYWIHLFNLNNVKNKNKTLFNNLTIMTTILKTNKVSYKMNKTNKKI